jgi:flagellar biogenesis protein FliO
MGLLLLLMRRFAFNGKARAAPRMRIVESIALGPRQRIFLLRVNDHEILVGATQQQIVNLGRWDYAPDVESQPPDSRVEPKIAISTATVLNRRGHGVERTA